MIQRNTQREYQPPPPRSYTTEPAGANVRFSSLPAGAIASHGPPPSSDSASSVGDASSWSTPRSVEPPRVFTQVPVPSGSGSNFIPETAKPALKDKASATAVVPQFQYGTVLFLSLLPPLAVILVFGGRTTLLLFCFGSLVMYFFDLIGSIEGSLMSAIITLFGAWATLIYAARPLLHESVLNFSLVFVMGWLLCYLFVVVNGHFASVLRDFDSLFCLLESLLTATLPFLSSVILTWFFTVEMPVLDITQFFCIIYFAYTLVLARPRSPSIPPNTSIRNNNNNGNKVYMLSSTIVQAMYALPVLYTPLLYVAMHHRVWYLPHHVPYLVASVVSPVFLMSYCCESHMAYFASTSQQLQRLQARLENIRVIAGAFLVYCAQTHPMFDDLKSFRFGVDKDPNGAIFAFVSCMLAGLLFLVVKFSRIAQQQRLREQSLQLPGHSDSSSSNAPNIWDYMTLACVVLGCCAISLLFHLPFEVMPLLCCAGMSLQTYYLGEWSTSGSTWWLLLSRTFFVVCAAFGCSAAFDAFLKQTLIELTVDFTWYIEMSIQQWCAIAVALLAFAVIMPAVAYWSQSQASIAKYAEGRSGLQSNSISSSNKNSSLSMYIFEWLYAAFAVCVALFELMIREQNWQGSLHVDIEAVYPVHLLMGTGILLGFSSFLAHTKGLMRFHAVWVVWLSQGSKALHLIGFPSHSVVAIVYLLYAYTSPFVDFVDPVVQAMFRSSQQPSVTALSDEDILDTSRRFHSSRSGDASDRALDLIYYIYYLIQGALSTTLARRLVAEELLVMTWMRSPTPTQTTSACIALYLAYLTALSLAFIPKWSFVRSLLAVFSVLAALVSADALGPYRLTYDPQSSAYLALSLSRHPDLATVDHSGFFLIVSAVLVAAVHFRFMPAKRPLQRLLFLVAFSYSATEALLGWCYPATLSVRDSPHHGWMSFPFVHTLLLVGISTSSVLHSNSSSNSNSSSKQGSNSQSNFGLLVLRAGQLWVFLGLLYCELLEYTVLYDGLLWAALLVTTGVSVAVRGSDILRFASQWLRHPNSANTIRGSVTQQIAANPVTATVCAMSALTAVAFAAALSFVDPHIDVDVFLPAWSLVLLATKPGLLMDQTHPLAIAAVVSAGWWTWRLFYNVFVHEYGSTLHLEGFEPSFSMFEDVDISIWANKTLMLPLLNLAMGLLPLPAVILSFLRDNKHQSEEIMFVLSTLSAVPVIGAQASCVRYLGLVGLVFGGWRCYDIGVNSQISNRYI